MSQGLRSILRVVVVEFELKVVVVGIKVENEVDVDVDVCRAIISDKGARGK